MQVVDSAKQNERIGSGFLDMEYSSQYTEIEPRQQNRHGANDENHIDR